MKIIILMRTISGIKLILHRKKVRPLALWNRIEVFFQSKFIFLVINFTSSNFLVFSESVIPRCSSNRCSQKCCKFHKKTPLLESRFKNHANFTEKHLILHRMKGMSFGTLKQNKSIFLKQIMFLVINFRTNFLVFSEAVVCRCSSNS